jgi:hypothetical protein
MRIENNHDDDDRMSRGVIKKIGLMIDMIKKSPNQTQLTRTALSFFV